MSLIRNIEVQHQGTTTNYDIGADAENITYDSSHSVKDKIDNLGTAAAKDVPASGNASATEVVMGNDSRLTNARVASNISYTSTDPGAGSALTTGNIVLVYEP